MLYASDCARRKNSRCKRKPGQRRSLISGVHGFGLFIWVVWCRRISLQDWACPPSFQCTLLFNYLTSSVFDICSSSQTVIVVINTNNNTALINASRTSPSQYFNLEPSLSRTAFHSSNSPNQTTFSPMFFPNISACPLVFVYVTEVHNTQPMKELESLLSWPIYLHS